jgi:AcrR family transcriptional regulator
MDKKEKLLQAALKLFVEFGFHNTPTSKIAREAGIANGTLFYFFPTKDDLVKALYVDLKSQLAAHTAETIRNKTDLRAMMQGYYTATLIWAQQNRTAFRFMEQFNTSPYLHQLAEEEMQKHIKPLLGLLEKGMQDKIIKAMDVDIIFTLISGHTFSINQYLISKQLNETEQEKVIHDTFDLLWDMIT